MSTSPDKGAADASADKARMDRRGFFRAGGAAAVVAAVAIVPAAEEAAAAESAQERSKARYRETEHVKNYYRVNRY
ncbi:MAG: hypothetical protein JWL62_1294 [Hyphomicrobiales bacterium]|jgi:hypothetical protein|nr:hypothetical protein [Hyphomicrobiales bacterium]